MKIRTATIRWSSLCAVSAILLVSCIVSIFYYIKVSEEALEEMAQISEDAEYSFLDERNTYAGETCYVGTPYLPDDLFRIPFQRTGGYINNNDFIARIGEENAELFVQKSKDAIAAMFSMSYQERDINDQVLKDSLADGLHVLFVDGTLAESKEETVEKINGWFINNQISMEAQLYTDKCMVFFDESKVIVRGQMVFSVYGSGDTGILKEHLELDVLEPGERYAVVLEVEYISKSNAYDYDSYQICGIKCR